MNTSFKSTIVGIFVFSLLAIASLSACSSPASRPSSTAVERPTTTVFEQTSATISSETGLSLTLSLSSTTYQPGDRVSITVDEKNMRATENSVQAADNWPAKGLRVGPCGVVNYPFGISILKGYYDAKSIASVSPLQLYDPGVLYNCPLMLAGITSYDFQPQSDVAAIYTRYDTEPFSINMTAQLTSAGFWSGSQKATFSNFTLGTYTVVGGDEWGTLAILHFVVSRTGSG